MQGLRHVRGVVRCQSEGVRKELRGDLGDGRLCPQILQLPNNLRGKESGSPCTNLMGSVIRLSRGFLAKVFQVVSFRGETGEVGI